MVLQEVVGDIETQVGEQELGVVVVMLALEAAAEGLVELVLAALEAELAAQEAAQLQG
jgi:hypothetical protein